MNTDFIPNWFDKLCDDVSNGNGLNWRDGRVSGKMLAEILSDCSNELFVSAVLAAHLRNFGREFLMAYGLAGHFWARSEWDKFDLCYGVALSRFENWNHAWARGDTGDLGTIELKVHYDHYPVSKTISVAASLGSQLESRRKRIADFRSDADSMKYYGIVVGIGSTTGATSLDATLNSVGLHQVRRWRRLASLTGEELLSIWPRKEAEAWTLRLALFEYVPANSALQLTSPSPTLGPRS